MDDMTLIMDETEVMKRMLARLDELILWSRMKLKPKKSRSLPLASGEYKSVRFQISGENIPTAKEESLKSLGRWYSLPLTDCHHGVELHKIVSEGLEAIKKSGLPGKFKLWCFQFGLLPRILWPM